MANLGQIIVGEFEALAEPALRAATDPQVRRFLLAHLPSLGLTPDQYDGLASRFADLGAAVDELGTVLSTGGDDIAIERVLAATQRAATALRAAFAEPLSAGTIGPNTVVEFIAALVGLWLETRHPALARTLDLLTLSTPPGEGVNRVPWSSLRLDRLSNLLQDPVGTLRAEYAPRGLTTSADARLVADKLFPRVARLLNSLGISAAYGLDPYTAPDFGAAGNQMGAGMLTVFVMPGGTSIFGATFALSAADAGDLGLVIVPFGVGTLEARAGQWSIETQLSGAGLGFAIGPRGVTVDAGTVRAGARLAVRRLPPADAPNAPALLIGDPRGTRVEIGGLTFICEVSASAAAFDASLDFDLGRGMVVVAAGEVDSFLRQILPRDGLRASFDFGVGWSKSRGLYFHGSAGLEAALNLRLRLGPLFLEALHLLAAARADGLTLEVSLTGSLRLGPIEVSVRRIGLAAVAAFRQGNLGPLDGSFRFKPPTGLGINIAAGPVHGGGFVDFDVEQGRYFGVLQLHVFAVTVNAVALLETRLPGGTPAFSFLLLITAEFPPLQLGMGFTLNGLGGMAGLHRSIAAEPFRASLREGSVSRLLFPEDPVRNAPRVLQDIQQFLPARADRYLFGPVAKIGYGTPTIIEAQLGVVLELPEPFRIVLLGVLRARFPNREHPVVRINLDALGVLDFGERTFSLDASLYDSRVAAFELSGDMALRLAWGDAPTFALSVGGFNPHFTPPPNFPALRRLTLALGSGENPRLALEAYFALTSNTLQFGARATLHAEAAGFSVDGELSFDALIIFNPFGFRIDIAAALALRGLGMTLAAVRLEATIEGPRPWHITGHARVTIIIEVQVDFDARFGEEERLPAPPQIDPWEVLRPELLKVENWAAELPPAGARVVSFGTRAGGAERLVDPVGGLSVRQQAVPLGRRISKVGERRLAEPREITVGRLRVGSERFSGGELQALTAPFAAGQFEDLTEAEKLSRPSFEQMNAGVRVASRGVTCGVGVGGELTYETVAPGAAASVYALSLSAQLAALRYSAAGTQTVRQAGLGAYAPDPGREPGVALGEETFVIVSTDTLTRTAIASPGAHGAVAARLDEYLRANPAARGTLQVMPEHELEAA
ncbi:MAG TPA: DUF6603 domain-containing protein [Pyrinomonadaceae bacterium]|nr:DUF6603 domain-containing protein [Pyrinomonadaceae bacterium]